MIAKDYIWWGNMRCQVNFASIAQLVECCALGFEVVGSNLPAVPEVTLDGHSRDSLTIPR